MSNILLWLIYPMAPVALPKGWIREAAEKTGTGVEEKFAAFVNAVCARVWSEHGVKTGMQWGNVCMYVYIYNYIPGLSCFFCG